MHIYLYSVIYIRVYVFMHEITRCSGSNEESTAKSSQQ